MYKLPDSEIVKALECCSAETIMYCEDQCPFYEKCIQDENLCRYALDLINRQNAKIEYQNAEIELLREERAKANVENVRLKDKLTKAPFPKLVGEYELLKLEAYKECIEKVNERLAVHSFTSNSTEYTDGMLDCMEWVDSKIDELEKELVGEDDAE